MPDRIRIAVLLGPALFLILALFGGGLGAAVMRSLNYMPVIGMTDPDLNAYRTILGSGEFLGSLGLSLHIAITSTLLSAILAVAAALMLRRSFAGKRIITFLFQMNLTVPHLVGAIGILYLFSQSGSFARLAYHAGFLLRPADFPALVYDPYAIGIILLYVWKEVPFIGLIVLAKMQTLSSDQEFAARSLGANPWQVFRHVLMPQVLPSLLSASVLVFAFTFGAFEIPALLGQNYPAALPVLSYRSHTSTDLADRPEAMAMAVVISLVGAGVVWIYLRMARPLGGGQR